MNNIKILFILLSVLLMDACSSIQPVQSKKNLEIDCTTPKSIECTLEYDPVCANKYNGIQCKKSPCPDTDKVSFSNSCKACSDINVYSFELGLCK
jgi:hypothetical protein